MGKYIDRWDYMPVYSKLLRKLKQRGWDTSRDIALLTRIMGSYIDENATEDIFSFGKCTLYTEQYIVIKSHFKLLCNA